MSTDVMTADRWHRVAARHVKLKTALGAKAAALQTDLEKAATANDLKGLVAVIARCNHNVKRLQQIEKVIARHMRRYLINVKIQKRH
jgi:DNA-binding protein YbaB